MARRDRQPGSSAARSGVGAADWICERPAHRRDGPVCILNRDEPSLHGSGAGHAPARYRLFPPCNSDRLTRGGARSLQVVDASALRLTRVRFKAGIQPQQPSALSASGYHRKTCIMKFTGTRYTCTKSQSLAGPHAPFPGPACRPSASHVMLGLDSTHLPLSARTYPVLVGFDLWPRLPAKPYGAPCWLPHAPCAPTRRPRGAGGANAASAATRRRPARTFLSRYGLIGR